jgi:hypothetical protein
MFVLVFCLVLVRVSKKESGLIKEQASKDRLLKACESTPLIMRGTYLQSTPQLCLWSEVDESSRAYLSALYTRVPTILHTRNNSISPNTPIDGVPLIHASNILASRTCINRWISLQLSQIQTHCDDIHHTSNPATRMSPLIPPTLATGRRYVPSLAEKRQTASLGSSIVSDHPIGSVFQRGKCDLTRKCKAQTWSTVFWGVKFHRATSTGCQDEISRHCSKPCAMLHMEER